MIVVSDGQVWAVYINREVWLAKELVTPFSGAMGPTFRWQRDDFPNVN